MNSATSLLYNSKSETMNESNFWYLENVDLTTILCPQKLGNALNSHSNSMYKKGDYIYLKTTKETHRVHNTLKKIREKLPEELFLQIHRSFIINFTRIIDIEDNSVLIEKNVIPISRSNRPELMRRLNLL